MADQEYIDIIKQGVEAWNRWRENNPSIRIDLSESDLSGLDLRAADLRETNLRGADLSETELNAANLYRADLVGADLRKAHIRGADLGETDLNSANLYMADLSETILIEADLRGANLSGAVLRDADLSGANLREADLSKSVLRGAHLEGADLSVTELFEADLRRTNLLWANLSGADLGRTDLDECVIGWTNFGNIDLSQAKGLENILHDGPSIVGVDTIFRSKGLIPAPFLRESGVPEIFIEYLPSLVTGDAIQFYSCFISYSTRDQGFAERLHTDLQSHNVRCWFAPEDAKGGEKLHEQIPKAIRLYDKLLLVLSSNSMNSEWVKTEIYHARQEELRKSKHKLFPISLVPYKTLGNWEAFDADVGKDMAREIREYNILDFSNWKDHDAYQKALERLLRDLKSDESPGTTE